MHSAYTVVGDLHLTLKTVEKSQDLFRQVEEMNQPVIWLGDLLDTKEVIRGKCLNSLYDYFKSSKLYHIVIVGNHDWFNLDCLDHSLKALSSIPNVVVVDTPQSVFGLDFIPYMHDREKLKTALNNVPKGGTVFAHLDMSGFDYGNGHICEDGLAVKDFKRFAKVISGHFHKYQEEKNFVYLGTPFSHSFGEANQPKFIATYLRETGDLNLIPTNFPKHVSIKLDMSSSEWRQHISVFLRNTVGDIRRVQLFGTSEQCAQLDKSEFTEHLIKWEDKSQDEVKVVNLDETLTNKDQFVEWATNIQPLDQETIKLGLSILEFVDAK